MADDSVEYEIRPIFTPKQSLAFVGLCLVLIAGTAFTHWQQYGATVDIPEPTKADICIHQFLTGKRVEGSIRTIALLDEFNHPRLSQETIARCESDNHETSSPQWEQLVSSL